MRERWPSACGPVCFLLLAGCSKDAPAPARGNDACGDRGDATHLAPDQATAFGTPDELARTVRAPADAVLVWYPRSGDSRPRATAATLEVTTDIGTAHHLDEVAEGDAFCPERIEVGGQLSLRSDDGVFLEDFGGWVFTDHTGTVAFDGTLTVEDLAGAYDPSPILPNLVDPMFTVHVEWKPAWLGRVSLVGGDPNGDPGLSTLSFDVAEWGGGTSSTASLHFFTVAPDAP